MADLVIKVNGDIKGFKDALDQAEAKSESLRDQLGDISKVAGVAFAALTAEIGLSVKAFASQQEATNRLSNSLQNQGIYTDALVEKYRAFASAVQEKAGLDDDEVVKAQATIQALIGQTQVTEKMTFAIADLAEAKHLDLESSAELIGKGIAGHTMALGKLGIEIDSHLNKEQRTAEILKQVELRFGGMATAANQGIGGIRGLGNAFGDLQEGIGQRLAPIVEVIIKQMTQFFAVIANNKAILDMVTSVIIAGTVVTGLVTAVGAGTLAFIKLQAAMEAAEIATGAMSLATKGLVGATGLGLLLIVGTEIALNWNSVWPRMQAVYQTFANNVSQISGGLGSILKGVFTFDVEKIKAGLEQAKGALVQGYDEYKALTIQKMAERNDAELSSIETQNEAKAAMAEAQAEKEAEHEDAKTALNDALNQERLMKSQQASAALLELKSQEIEALKLIEDEKFQGDKDALQTRAEELRSMQEEQKKIDDDISAAYRQQLLGKSQEFQNMSASQQAMFIQQNAAQQSAAILNKQTAQQAALRQQMDEQIKANNTFLLEEQKYGTAYATIHKMMHSEVYQGTKNALFEMQQMQTSENAALKAIGKAAAIANIAIKTAESAMAIYAGFAAIPIVGPGLGLLGAGAAIAFGAEQVSRVTAAAQGGLITGGIPGIDSVPVMAQQGELVSPVSNFEEVIGSVRAAREAENMRESTGFGGGGVAQVIIGFDGPEASRVLTARQIEDQNLGLSQEATTS
jgi:hypothetical protein